MASEGLLTDGFFWIPSLAGPTTVNVRATCPALAARCCMSGSRAQQHTPSSHLQGGLDWLFKWQDGAPLLGYGQTAAYLVLPILLVVSQVGMPVGWGSNSAARPGLLARCREGARGQPGLVLSHPALAT